MILLSGHETKSYDFPLVRKPFLQQDLMQVMKRTTGCDVRFSWQRRRNCVSENSTALSQGYASAGFSSCAALRWRGQAVR